MILLDVNVLLAVHRVDHPHYEIAEPWFSKMLSEDEPFWVPDVIWAGFVRIATSRKIFPVPTPSDDAFAFLRAIRGQPNHVDLVPTARHVELFEELCKEADVSGELVQDAYIAAHAMEHNCEVISFDRDFARFSSLKWRRPDE